MPFPKGILRGPSSNAPYPASWGFFCHIGNSRTTDVFLLFYESRSQRVLWDRIP